MLNNCFGPIALNRVLYLKLKPQMPYVKPFLVLLNILQNMIENVGVDDVVYTDSIEMDAAIVARLREVLNAS